MNRDEYENYRRSQHWINLSRATREAHKVCESCAFPYELNVHHKTYERLGHERPSDLIVLCRSCHSRGHFVDDLYSYPEFFTGNAKETVERLKRQQEEARRKNIERQDEIRQNKEKEQA